jgi:hypothetical protein
MPSTSGEHKLWCSRSGKLPLQRGKYIYVNGMSVVDHEMLVFSAPICDLSSVIMNRHKQSIDRDRLFIDNEPIFAIKLLPANLCQIKPYFPNSNLPCFWDTS